jgi:uncharacterized glyoxalase superfamily protein PhnB
MDDRRTWKPRSYLSVSPYLVVAGAQKVIDFAKAVFGATELRRYDMPDGSIMHAEIRIPAGTRGPSRLSSQRMVMIPGSRRR